MVGTALRVSSLNLLGLCGKFTKWIDRIDGARRLQALSTRRQPRSGRGFNLYRRAFSRWAGHNPRCRWIAGMGLRPMDIKLAAGLCRHDRALAIEIGRASCRESE